MRIIFLIRSAYDFDHMAVAFPVVVDGDQKRVLVSADALQDHFGAYDSDNFVAVFESNRHAIEAVAARMIEQGASGEIILKSGMF